MTAKKFSQALGDGPVVVVGLEPPAGSDLTEFAARAENIKDKVDAFLIADNPLADALLSANVAAKALADKGLETIVGFNCRDRNRLALVSDLLAADALGLPNVLCVSGEHPALGPNPGTKSVYDLDSVQLLDLVRNLNEGRRLDGQSLTRPTNLFPGASVNPEVHSPTGQMLKFRLKAASGAKFFITQAIFHPECFEPFRKEASERGVKLLAGLRIVSEAEAPEVAARKRPWLNALPDLAAELAANPAGAVDRTVEIARQAVSALKNSADGFVVMAPGLADRLPEILERLGLVGGR